MSEMRDELVARVERLRMQWRLAERNGTGVGLARRALAAAEAALVDDMESDHTVLAERGAKEKEK